MAAEPARHLVLVDADTGEQLKDGCPECANYEDVVRGLERKVRGLILENANLRRDKEAEARASGLWPASVVLWGFWKAATHKATGSKRKSSAKFSYDRFALLEPFLRNYDPDRHQFSVEPGPPRNVFEECLAAIVGRVYDHFETQRPNGTVKHFFEWERIFDCRKEFEESIARRPRDWRDRVFAIEPTLAVELEDAPEPSTSAKAKRADQGEQGSMLRPADPPEAVN